MLSAVQTAWRTLTRSPGFSLTIIGTLGLGVAANLIVLALSSAYLLKPLPYPESDRLYQIRYTAEGQPFLRGLEKLDWSGMSDLYEHAITWDLDMFYVTSNGSTEGKQGAWVTQGFLDALGVSVQLGRSLGADDFRKGAPQAVLISEGYWRSRFAGDPNVIGRFFDAYSSDRPDEAEKYTIAGVVRADFWHLNPYTDVFAPLRTPNVPYMARLRPGVSPETAARRIEEITGVKGASLVQVQAAYVEQLKPVLTTVAIGTGLLLLIACANASFLLLVRWRGRMKEIAVREALGATSGAILRMLLAEGIALSTAATAVGLGLCWLFLGVIAPFAEQYLGRRVPGGLGRAQLDPAAISITLLFAFAAAVLFATGPYLVARHATLAGAIQAGGRGGRRAMFGWIAIEVAASVALLTAGTMMLRSVSGILAVPMGFEAGPIVTYRLTLRQASYPDPASRNALYARAIENLRAKGLESVAMSNFWPLQQPQEIPVASETAEQAAAAIAVSPGYFNTLAIPLREGREFHAGDRPGTPPVVVVSQTLARSLWPDGGAVSGRRIRIQDQWYNVAGVAGDVRQTPGDVKLADVYLCLTQNPSRFATFFFRMQHSARMEAMLRETFTALDPGIALSDMQALGEMVDRQTLRPRFLASVLSGFAGFSAVLSMLGLAGVIAYTVRQREHEVAVRIAVGASGGDVTRMFLTQGARVLALGVAAGAGGALLIGRAMQSQLFGVKAFDAPSLAAACALFAAAGLLAIWWPARMASRTDPIAALRKD